MNKKIWIIFIVIIILIMGVYCFKNLWISSYTNEKGVENDILYHLKKTQQNKVVDNIIIDKWLDINNKRVYIFSFMDKIESKKKLGYAAYSINKNEFKFDSLGYSSKNFSTVNLKTLDNKNNVSYKIFIYGDNSSIKAKYYTLNLNEVSYKDMLPENQVFLIPINTTFYSKQFTIGSLEFFDKNSINVTP